MVFIEILILLKKLMLWSIMLTPPKPIKVLDIIVFKVKDVFVDDKSKIPRVISIRPFKTEDTTL